ncbi:hypothetical protein NIES208_02325 [[Limnothrix rosea] IAM M-220]|nr:hypothetical protein NIES208_02325 [[Limnothrix rosea] IAM M-220]
MDTISIKVCHNRHISQHKVVDGSAAHGKTSVDWLWDFKLHPEQRLAKLVQNPWLYLVRLAPETAQTLCSL